MGRKEYCRIAALMEGSMMIYKVTDDSGFLGIINPDLYQSFVDENWEFDQLFAHFKMEIKKKNLLLWGTGGEGIWKVEVRNEISKEKGMRQFEGFIKVTQEMLCLTNYESLTMAAQFSDVKLPEKHQQDLNIIMKNGLYQCRIVQLFNPADMSKKGISYDFLVEFAKVLTGENNWEQIPWYENF